MSNPEETDSCVPGTQESYKNSSEDSEKKSFNENQNASWNESQDFHLMVESQESMTEKTKLSIEDKDASHQDSVEQSNLQQIPDIASQTDDKVMTANDEEVKNIGDKKLTDVNDLEKKDELSDEEDEIIQATPPHNYSPSRKASDVTSLKRKAGSFEDPPAKVAKVSIEDIADTEEKQLQEEEESRQSGDSDDSYQDLFGRKNIDRNVVIEETQDPTNQEFSQNSFAKPLECATTNDNDKTQDLPPNSEQVRDKQEDVFSEKRCSMEKDENLNVSAKLSDVSSTNDSIVVNINYSANESDSHVEDKGTEEAKKNVDLTLAVEKSAAEMLNETDSSVKAKDTEVIADESNKVEQTNCMEKSADNDEEVSSSQIKLQTSVELIYEGDNENKSKPDVVEINEDEGDKIVDLSAEVIYDCKKTKPEPEIVEIVDDSREGGERTRLDSGEGSEMHTTVGKSSIDFTESMKESSLDSRAVMTDSRMVNGSLESKKADNDATLNVDSVNFSCDATAFTNANSNIDNAKKLENVKSSSFVFRYPENIELISLSDNDTSNVEEKNKSDLITHNKTMQVEREIYMLVKLKCTLQVDENTKEHVSKEVTAVHCEPVILDSTGGHKHKNEDSQSSLADISDNKESSPGSVNSNPQLYQLNPSRLSLMSTISSSSSASSAATLATRLALKTHFQTSMRFTKKLSSQESLVTDKLDEIYDRITREWKNHHSVTATILNHANTELGNTNISNVELDHRNPPLRENFMRSSTPAEDTATGAKTELTTTPKSTKKGKAVKRPRSKASRSSAQSNGNEDVKNVNIEPTHRLNVSSVTETDTPSKKKSRLENTEIKLDVGLGNSSLRNDPADELIGKRVFAKWSDNIYYPGIVSDRLKSKYKVNFYDGKSKTLIPEFVIPIPKILREGLSVYASTKANDYGSCGIIIDSHTSSRMNNGKDDDDDDTTYYTVETDEGERLRVQVRNIFLFADQAQVLKEEVDTMDKSSLPSTPKALGQVTLDNMVEGKRRSKRTLGTPVFSTPKSRSSGMGSNSTSKVKPSEPSVSGVSGKLKDQENEGMSSDSNVASQVLHDDYILTLRGVQREIIGTPYEQIMKGPQNRIKGKSRKKKIEEDAQTIATLGPIPTNSTLFKDMSFILACVSLETLDRFLDIKVAPKEREATDTEVETENEEDWVERPFVRERLHKQILAGGGKIYEDFDQIPKDEYKNTTLITNVPNRTIKSLLCLSNGISVCNHKWIIRCCSEGKLVKAAENALPMGWSLQKNSYVEIFDKCISKPLSGNIVIIPNLVYDHEFAIFWRQICENAGAVVLIVDNLEVMETMDFGRNNAIVLSNRKCPSWAVDRANQLRIPILSTMWVTQCLIEGKLCPHNQHPRYKYNYKE